MSNHHQVHDWLILLGREVEHVWRTKWSLGKILYIISRYGPFFGVPVTIISEAHVTLARTATMERMLTGNLLFYSANGSLWCNKF